MLVKIWPICSSQLPHIFCPPPLTHPLYKFAECFVLKTRNEWTCIEFEAVCNKKSEEYRHNQRRFHWQLNTPTHIVLQHGLILWSLQTPVRSLRPLPILRSTVLRPILRPVRAPGRGTGRCCGGRGHRRGPAGRRRRSAPRGRAANRDSFERVEKGRGGGRTPQEGGGVLP